MILDTNALSAVADASPEISAAWSRATEIAIPVIVLGEYRYGIAQSRWRDRHESWLRQSLSFCRVLEITDPTTLHYAEVRAQLRKAGKPIPSNDLWIAALCRQYNLPILSRDKHFDWVEGVRRIAW